MRRPFVRGPSFTVGLLPRATADGIDEEQAVNEITVLFVRQFDEGEPIERERNTSTNAELRVKGLGVSDGVAIGRVLRIQGATHDLYRASIGEQDVERERRRFRTARNSSRLRQEPKGNWSRATPIFLTRIYSFSTMQN